VVDIQRSTIAISKYMNVGFTDAIYELVKAESLRIHSEGIDIVQAAELAAYFATLPIAAIAAGGKKGLEDQIEPLCNNFIFNLKELTNG
jgi:hypothetical protein